MNDDEQKNSFEHRPEPKFAIKRTLGLFAVSLMIMCSASCFVNKPEFDLQERTVQLEPAVKTVDKSVEWAAKINQINADVGRSVQALWNMLGRRRGDLEEVANELSNLLYANAERQLDFCAQESMTLLSRYQAMNARYTLDIANQIRLINDLISKTEDPILVQSFNELVAEFGCENYATEQVYIVKHILSMEADYKQILAKLATSTSILEIRQHVKSAMQTFSEMKRNGYAETFLELGLLQQELAPSVESALENFLQAVHGVSDASLSSPETYALLETILDDAGIQEGPKVYWLGQFQKLMQIQEQLQAQIEESLQQKTHIATSETA